MRIVGSFPKPLGVVEDGHDVDVLMSFGEDTKNADPVGRATRSDARMIPMGPHTRKGTNRRLMKSI
jgi:hypothetical protein